VNPTICDRDRIRTAATILQGVEVRSADFEISIESAAPGDLVYLDPPYVSGHQNNGFLKYNAPLFAWGDQKRLSDCAMALAESGVHVLVSNADHPAVIRLYKGFRYYRAKRRSLIGANCANGVYGDESAPMPRRSPDEPEVPCLIDPPNAGRSLATLKDHDLSSRVVWHHGDFSNCKFHGSRRRRGHQLDH